VGSQGLRARFRYSMQSAGRPGQPERACVVLRLLLLCQTLRRGYAATHGTSWHSHDTGTGTRGATAHRDARMHDGGSCFLIQTPGGADRASRAP